MEINEIKKVLYRERPMADFVAHEKGSCTYKCNCSLGEIIFTIPDSEALLDSGMAIWEQSKIPAQFLIRWLNK